MDKRHVDICIKELTLNCSLTPLPPVPGGFGALQGKGCKSLKFYKRIPSNLMKNNTENENEVVGTSNKWTQKFWKVTTYM